MKEFISLVVVFLSSKAVSLSHGISRTERATSCTRGDWRRFQTARTSWANYVDSARQFNEKCPEYAGRDNNVHSPEDIRCALGKTSGKGMDTVTSFMIERDFPRLNPWPPNGSWLRETKDQPQTFDQFVERTRGMNVLRDIKRGRNTLYLQPVGTLVSSADLEDDAKLAEIEAKYGVRHLRFLRKEGWFLIRLKEYLSAFFPGMKVVVLDYVQLGQAVESGGNPGLRHGSDTSSSSSSSAPSSQSDPSRRRRGSVSFLSSSLLSIGNRSAGNRSAGTAVQAAPVMALPTRDSPSGWRFRRVTPLRAEWMAVPTRDSPELEDTLPSHYQIEASAARTVLARLSTARVVPYNGHAFLGVTMEDLYGDDRTEADEVYSVADLAGTFIRVGIFSVYKFYMPEKERFPSNHGLPDVLRDAALEARAVLEVRLLKNVCMTLSHAVTHTFGVQHCLHFNCLMQGAWNEAERDSRFHEVCPVCLKKLHFSFGFDPVFRYKALARWAGEVRAEGGWFDYERHERDTRARSAAGDLVFGGWQKWFSRRATTLSDTRVSKGGIMTGGGSELGEVIGSVIFDGIASGIVSLVD